MLVLNQNDTNPGIGSLRMYKNTSTNGAPIGEISFQAKNSTGTQIEYGRLQGSITNSTSGNGVYRIFSRINNVITEVIRVGGANLGIDFFRNVKQEFTSGGNTKYTDLENDATNHRIKLSETATTGYSELTKSKLQLDAGVNNFAKIQSTGLLDLSISFGAAVVYSQLSYSDLQFQGISARPQRFYQSAPFSVSGSPSNTIFDLGLITGMTAGTRWTISVGFSATTYTNQNAICYQVIDTSNVNSDTNSAMGWNSASSLNVYQSAFPSNPTTPNGSYLSFSDTFGVSGSATGTCKVVITGGTYSSVWSGTAIVTVVLVNCN
jgi:hypothetical protein